MSSGSSLNSKVKTLIKEGGIKKTFDAFEDAVVGEIEEYIKEESFYELPINEIIKIVGKSEFKDIDILCEFISRMSENKGGESTLLLNVIKREEATLEECIKILSNFKQCPICQRTNDAFNKLPERDFERELEELKKEIEKLQKEAKEKRTFFPPVTEKPPDFERNICKASEEGRLASVQYLVEQLHADVETKGNFGWTPMICASINGRLEVVQYLYEKCHADAETKNILGCTPINYASANGRFEVVKYLYEICHANVETKDKAGRTPIFYASLNGRLEVVKYLYETCHAKITEDAVTKAKTKEIRNYLISKI